MGNISSEDGDLFIQGMCLLFSQKYLLNLNLLSEILSAVLMRTLGRIQCLSILELFNFYGFLQKRQYGKFRLQLSNVWQNQIQQVRHNIGYNCLFFSRKRQLQLNNQLQL
eukprot:TRINITY_DN6815_c0_g1_i10.p5 TRINITY_DN6815_c0_g1~~TRINITY_DN6815_c0_g1_i10.p5  ORF type:complete len:110 (-),score=4.68 TRINITY_DN6815_c0_g1_i10:414-743(-)